MELIRNMYFKNYELAEIFKVKIKDFMEFSLPFIFSLIFKIFIPQLY